MAFFINKNTVLEGFFERAAIGNLNLHSWMNPITDDDYQYFRY